MFHKEKKHTETPKKGLVEVTVYKLGTGEFVALLGTVLVFMGIVWGIVQYFHASINREKEKLYEQRIAFLKDKLEWQGKKYMSPDSINKNNVNTKGFVFTSIKDGETLEINSSVHVDGYIERRRFDPKSESIWIFFKLDDNYYIKPSSRAGYIEDTGYWDTTLRFDTNYSSIIAFKVDSKSNKMFRDWARSKFGGIKKDEFPQDTVKLGEVSVNAKKISQ